MISHVQHMVVQARGGCSVEVALKEGYRLIDGAYLYGNEKEIGGALQKCFKGVVKREDLFITSKLGYVYSWLLCTMGH